MGVLSCAGCGRSYPLHVVGDGSLEIPGLMRDDALATLDQDIVVARSDPESARLDYRRHIDWAERRERFLAPLVHHTTDDTAAPPTGPARHGAAIGSAGVPPVPGDAGVTVGVGEPRRRAPLLSAEPSARGESRLFDRFVGGLPIGGIALDLGCGAGAWTARLAERGLRVVGVDTSLAHLEGAAAATAATGAAGGGTRALFVEADPLELPFAAASADGIWCAAAFVSVRPDRRAVFFRQANRALRPGGLLCFGAGVAPPGETLRRYLLWRYVYHRPVVRGEYIERPPRGRVGGWRYRAMVTARELRDLCHDHGFRVLALSHAGSRLLLVARKERGTDA